jgi:uncharacterized protein YciI
LKPELARVRCLIGNNVAGAAAAAESQGDRARMLFTIACTDKPASLELRLATRPAHIEHLKAQAGRIVLGGPVLDPAGNPCGSLLVVEAADRAEAEAFAAADPYAKAGLFESVAIRPFRTVFKDGAAV